MIKKTNIKPYSPESRSFLRSHSFFEVISIFLRLGITSFGGPIAHIGFFRDEFVERRKWVDEVTYADIVALCQFLPGPSSSQVGIVLGIMRSGFLGGVAAWIGFTFPSALAMIAFAYGVSQVGDLSNVAWLHGLKIVAVAVVAQAVWGMARNLCPDIKRATLAIAVALLTLMYPSAIGQLMAIIIGAGIGWRLLPSKDNFLTYPSNIPVSKGAAVLSIIMFVILLLGLPVAASITDDQSIKILSSFYRAGALVFGGGHVVLPLLQEAVVTTGWVGNDAFLAGYGAAQAIPGPLFAFAAYLGAAMKLAPNHWQGAFICLLAIYLPSFLLLIGALPFWDTLRHRTDVQSALKGVNATVVGILLGALYTPVFTSAIFSLTDFALAVLAYALLVFWRMPSWLVVLLGASSASLASPFV